MLYERDNKVRGVGAVAALGAVTIGRVFMVAGGGGVCVCVWGGGGDMGWGVGGKGVRQGCKVQWVHLGMCLYCPCICHHHQGLHGIPSAWEFVGQHGERGGGWGGGIRPVCDVYMGKGGGHNQEVTNR
jgi:hypothetical protein